MRVALDTNVLAYAEGVNDRAKRDAAFEIIRKVPREAIVIPALVLGELYNVLVRKVGRPRSKAGQALLGWSDAFAVSDTSAQVMLAAAGLATDHRLGIWDATIISSAAHAGCRLLLSEDLQDGFTWTGLTVVNPFVSPRHNLLSALLEPG